ncbi:30S ribosomal protein S9 [Patescibacteria group bacterium]|nr:30S ribosomal protein S9 [Patescibacteria group bacterium]MBU4023426.1 30S ribosomal protein S9 [Patescibacteria group bacterium]MBU4077993.1 30S ribosomal protein S9 [Patescibacteria group bacterium]
MPETKKTIIKKKIVKKDSKKSVTVKKKVVIKKQLPLIKKKTSEPKVKDLTSTEIYFEGVGRRKTAIARVRIFPKLKNEFIVNEKKYSEYFSTYEMEQKVFSPLILMNMEEKFKVTVKVKGSGLDSQAEAVRHGLARALVKFNPEFRKRLKKAGFLTRDPRMRERKKFGRKRARKSPQWSKR